MKFRKKTTATILIAVFILSIFTVAIPLVSAVTITVGSSTETYDTIQEAITAATGEDTIVVSAGTYTEDLVIPAGKDGLELSGATGAIIEGIYTHAGAPVVYTDANILVESDNVKIHGFTIRSPTTATDQMSDGLVFSASGLEICDNAFEFVGVGTSLGIGSTHYAAVPTTDIDGLYIHDNTFSGTPTQSYEGIYINEDSGTGSITIEDNTFSGTLRRAIISEESNVIIAGNTLTSTFGTGAIRGIDICALPAISISNVQVTGNDISGFGWGINFGDGGKVNTLSGVVAQGNTIDDATIGVHVRGATAVGIVVNYNDILTGGVTNIATAGTLNAEKNWWGTDDLVLIEGMVDGLVDYVPYLSESSIGMEVDVEPATYALTLTIVGSGTVTIDRELYLEVFSEGVHTINLENFEPAPVYTLTALPETYWKLESWSEDLSGSVLIETITLDGPMSVTATFVPKTVSIEVTDPVPPAPLDFGTVIDGKNSEVETVTVMNTGEVDVTVTADIADVWYQLYLQIGSQPYLT